LTLTCDPPPCLLRTVSSSHSSLTPCDPPPCLSPPDRHPGVVTTITDYLMYPSLVPDHRQKDISELGTAVLLAFIETVAVVGGGVAIQCEQRRIGSSRNAQGIMNEAVNRRSVGKQHAVSTLVSPTRRLEFQQRDKRIRSRAPSSLFSSTKSCSAS
ncbi:unnamed protein product, partial [Pleuronectes platessa]